MASLSEGGLYRKRKSLSLRINNPQSRPALNTLDDNAYFNEWSALQAAQQNLADVSGGRGSRNPLSNQKEIADATNALNALGGIDRYNQIQQELYSPERAGVLERIQQQDKQATSTFKRGSWQDLAKIGALVGGAAYLGAPAAGSSTGTTAGTVAGTGGGATGGIGGSAAMAPGSAGAGFVGQTGTAGIAGAGQVASSQAAGLGLGGAAGAGAAATGGSLSSLAGGGALGTGLTGGQLALGLGGIGATLYGTQQNKKAAEEAAKTSAAATQGATDLQGEMFRQTQENQRPWLEAGTRALGRQEALLNDPSLYQQDPYNAWLQEQGAKQIDRSASSRGQVFSGGALKELMKYGQGMAGSGFNDQYNRLATLSGTGQAGASNMAGQANQYAQNVGNLNMQNAATQGNLSMARAGQNNQMLSSLLNTGAGMYGMYNQNQQNQALINALQNRY